MASSSPSTTSPTLAVPGHPHRRPSPLPSCYSPLAASSSPAVSSISASAAPKHKPRGLGLRCRAAEEGPAPARGEAPPKVMISGAPASGKGTQCQRIVEKYGLVHISTGDLLRAEVSSGTEIGKTAKEYMDSGKLVPDQVVTDMVVSRLSQPDVQERGWLLDGYPRSFSQAQSLESMKIRPDIFIVLEVPDDILIDRCVGRRLDPVTGKIYHVKNFPPENEEISARLITRSDDTFEKVKSRLETYKQNSEAILPTYSDLLNQIDGNRPAEVVFQEIDSLLQKTCGSTSANKLTKTNGKPPDSLDTSSKNEWRGIPTRLNNIPHSREIRQYFYDDVVQATKRAVEDKKTRLQININIPELNPEMDVYRIGASEVDKEDDMFILIAPQNAVGNCIIDDMRAMTDAAGDRPVILVNPRLKDMPGSSGVMQTMGRDMRLKYAASFETCYSFRLLFYAGSFYPIMGALRMAYPNKYEIYRRVDEPNGKEKYVFIAEFTENPTPDDITGAFKGPKKEKEKASSGFWGFLSGIL
ncbi:probable adenylate kinase 5, chloroplastic isoform X2 [Phragmites australis]|uniref:probable adenylate kinase 5, chloroplastic isoform X2 n=1 Tax=Phragmites australis TaxID=29695 RepID=UPI002D780944|nr:probable adenylate kinase 5, chloroplastic isoform X2 [Phragmites australis]